jgi:ubiquinol-cytochrome c reductase cytochrome c subunit
VNEDHDFDAELGFEPAVSATGAEPEAHPQRGSDEPSPKRPGPRSLRRRLSAAAVLLAALLSMGGAYAAFASSSGAAGSTSAAQQSALGKQLYEVSCITCHGANLEGVRNRGPSLIGVGGAAVYFQVSTGRMPAVGQDAEQPRRTAKFNDAQTRALAAYIQSIGGGTAIPAGTLRGSDSTIADGGVLFRLNCSACHGATAKGGALSAGKNAPSLNAATTLQIYTAMLSGPESMPIFSDNQLTPSEKRAVVAYIQTLKATADPGGSGVDRIGPVSEAIVLWVGGVGALMVAILWIGAKSQ